jgi:GH18 family chitinase
VKKILSTEDKQNFTLMFKELRLELDNGAANGQEVLLTTAVGGF